MVSNGGLSTLVVKRVSRVRVRVCACMFVCVCVCVCLCNLKFVNILEAGVIS